MTNLKIRHIPFRFDDTVPFQWNPSNPEFGLIANCIGFLIVSMEKMIVSVVRKVLPRITDPAAAEEAEAFLRQEGLHAGAHRLHIRALLSRYPGLHETVHEINTSFRRLEEEHSVEFLLAYIAALEATFPPFFKMVLDHRDSLLTPGDSRVASLFAWHFVEEIEHRSSALLVYDAIVSDRHYRLRVVGPALAHAVGLFGLILDGFERHVPLEDRLIKTRRLLPKHSWFREVRARLLGLDPARDPYPTAFHAVPAAELASTAFRLLRAQLPSHRPADEPVPRWTETWYAAYERGDDMTTFEGTSPRSPS
jgi:predicted metal-dependent hydrolase